MNVLSQLKLARLINARKFDLAIELCANETGDGEDSDLSCVTMLCCWWRGERDRAFDLAQTILVDNAKAPRSAIEVAASYCVARPELPDAFVTVQRLARLNPDTGLRLILSNSAWFAHCVHPGNSQQLTARVKNAIDDFTSRRREQVRWAQSWLDADDIDRAQILPPPI